MFGGISVLEARLESWSKFLPSFVTAATSPIVRLSFPDSYFTTSQHRIQVFLHDGLRALIGETVAWVFLLPLKRQSF